MRLEQQMKDGLYGSAIGDALGVPYEFIPREHLKSNPCIEMTGYGSHNQPIGSWSDDTSMTLATLEALSHSDDKEIDYGRVMYNFVEWMFYNRYTPNDVTFDYGTTTYNSISQYAYGRDLWSCGGKGERDNGNGSLMRILPIAYHIQKYDIDLWEEGYDMVHNLSALTHAHRRSEMSCGIYITIALEIMNSSSNDLYDMVNEGLYNSREYYISNKLFHSELEHFDRLFSYTIQDYPLDLIKSGGYTINTLEASIHCLLNNDNYKDSVLSAVNLGFDTDTTACVCGGLGGLYYGFDSIPDEWISVLLRKDLIDGLIGGFVGE